MNFKPLLIQEQIPLADKNWFCTGGPAKFFAEPVTAHEFSQAVQYAQEHHLPLFMLGHGANILISDTGFNGLVIRPRNTHISIVKQDDQHATVRAGAGTSFADLILFCLDNHLIGLEEFSGIPGTVGGSVFINIHFFQHLLAQFITEATIIEKRTGLIQTVPTAWFEFGYDHSKLHTQEHYLIDAIFKLTKVDPLRAAYARGRHDEIIRYRNRQYPTERTCGSFFRNFFEHEVTLEVAGKKMIYVAYYLDKLGLKGQLSVGGAIVSHKHANMIVTHKDATSTDVVILARTMQELVHHTFGILPQAECQLVGFNEYPLLQDKNQS